MPDLVVSGDVLALGAVTGMMYGLLAVGLVLVYRTSKVINLAHGEIGALGASAAALAVVRWSVPYWLALVGALVLSGAVGAITETAVVRRLRRAPKLMSLVATLGVAQFLLLFSAAINSQARAGAQFPKPPWMPTFRIGALLVTTPYAAMLLLSPLVVVGLVVFLRRSRFGLALRAASSNAERARLVGISASQMSTLAWAMAGALAAFTAILVTPTRGFVTAEALGPILLSRALAAAVLARMSSLPIALAGGVGVGVIEQVLVLSYPTSRGFVDVVLLVGVTVALLFQARRGGREEERDDWTTVQPWRALPDRLRRIGTIRHLGWLAALAGLALAAALPLVLTNANAVSLVGILALALVGLSVGVVTGLGGQLTLGPFAVAGVGAAASYALTSHTGNFLLGFAAAAAGGAAASLLVGLPALRVRGQMLAVTTLLFALATPGWLLAQSWALGDGVNAGRPIIGSFALDTTKRYYYLVLVVFVIGALLARNVWVSGLGRRLRAMRDNEDVARSFGISPVTTRLEGYAVAGVLAGLGGALVAHLLPRVSASTFDVTTGFEITAMTILGGVALLFGPLLGALYIIGVPAFVPLDSAGLAATAFGWLVLILYFPGGIAQWARPVRRRLIDALARRAGVPGLDAQEEEEAEADVGIEAGEPHAGAGVEAEAEAEVEADVASATAHAPRSREVVPAGRPLLVAEGLHHHYGGLVAVDQVSLEVRSGETVGLIGPNGAGKTTLFELLGGFTQTRRGTVTFRGQDVTRLTPEARARAGLIRSFQDAALFPAMTVLDAVMLSLERSDPTRFLPAALGVNRADRRKRARAQHLIGTVGLNRYRDAQISELSTGTRRIAELTCMVALEPHLLLLDEPSSGIAQREAEALGEFLHHLKGELGLTLVVIEHDIPLVMSLADRVVAMVSGRVVADGSPEQVQQDPAVIASYLGTDARAIQRSEHHRDPAPTGG